MSFTADMPANEMWAFDKITSGNGVGSLREPSMSVDEVHRAAKAIKPFVARTPTLFNRTLSSRFRTNVYLKYEIFQTTGSFKVRGAFNRMLLANDKDRKGVVAVSAGNHAQAVAHAAEALGLQAMVLMPEDSSTFSIENTKRYGAEVKLFSTFADAMAAVPAYEQAGWEFIHPYDDAAVIAGQGTIGLEIMDDLPSVTDIILSIGGGGLLSGVATAVKTVRPDVRIWGVETFGADAMSKSIDAGRIVELDRVTSIAKTLGANRVGDLTFPIAKEYLAGLTVVEDKEALEESFWLLENSKVLTEPAASCNVAALGKLSSNFDAGSHVVVILCGGNIGMDELTELRANIFS